MRRRLVLLALTLHVGCGARTDLGASTHEASLAVLFGGFDGNTVYSVTWTFDGTAWKHLDVVGPLNGRSPVMAPFEGKLVLVGT